VFPVLKSIGRAFLPHALSSGSEVLSDLSKGENLGTSVKRRGMSLAKKAAEEALKGSGKKRKTKAVGLKVPVKKRVKKEAGTPKAKPKKQADYPFLK